LKEGFFMATFIAVYRGENITEAKLVAVSAEPELVSHVATKLLQAPSPGSMEDSVLTAIEQGRRRALRLIKKEVA
jgi:hypothetical protein